MLSVRDLTRDFERWGQRHRALDAVSFEIPAGEWVLVAGHNGSGKSTLMNLISGRLAPTSGSVRVAGRDAASIPPRALPDHVFYVHQDPMRGTAPLLSVFENLYVADRDPAGGRRALAARYAGLLGPLGLADKLGVLVRGLSGGERKLLSLLVARLQRAPLVLLDEPLAALDPERSRLAVEMIGALHAEGRTIVQISHEPEHIAALGDRVLGFDGGRLVRDERRVRDARHRFAPAPT